MPLRGICFDLDGTLADTMPVCIRAFQATIEHLSGRRPSEAEVSAQFGRNEQGILESMLPGRLAESLPEYVKQYEHFHAACPRPFAGVERLMDLLKARGMRAAIVTGKGKPSLEVSLRILGLERWVDSIETGFADRADKPGGIRAVLARWQIPPAQAAYVGDTPYDMQAARAAGVLPLGAAWSATAHLLREPAPEAAFTFCSLDEFIEWIETNEQGIPAGG
jgi:pyrophosphatase PpaX